MERIKRKNFFDGMLILLSVGLLFLFFVGFLILPTHAVSERENRVLRTWERPSWQALLGGSLSDSVGAAARDQFPMREEWISLKARCEQILGKRENNGILLGKDGVLMARNEYVDLSVTQENLRAAERFAEDSEIPVTRCWVPRSADVMSRWLPSPYPSEAANRLYRLLGATPISLLREAADEGKQVYYRTDHHLTTEGAYLLYCQLGNTLGYTPRDRSEFHIETVSENFLGSADSAVGGIATHKDRIELYRYEGDDGFLVTDEQTSEVREGFYDLSALERKDQYGIFLGGNFAHLSVREVGEAEKSRLLLVKDSFANALIPFLAIHFDLEVVDLRYLSGEIFLEPCDNVLILQGVDTLATDRSLGKLEFIKKKG